MHNLLKQQIKHHFGNLDKIPPELKDFLIAVDSAYLEAEEDYDLLERAMDLASNELLEKNADLKGEIDKRNQAEEKLKIINVDLENRVEERTADLLLANEKQEKEIQERRRAEEALILAKNEAERANRAKSHFLSRMSHELRTPMNAILGFGQLLEFDTSDPLSPGQKERMSEILKAGKHLLDLINEVLDLARIESGRQDLNIEEIKIQKVVGEVLPMILPLANERGIRVENQIALCSDSYVLADSIRLKQVLINLLSNAVKYNRQNGKVTLSVEVGSKETLKIHVLDTGVGIPAENHQDLFEPFNRLDAEKFDSFGTGIGLTITKQLVELMGGCVSVQSTLGKGSCFTVVMPRPIKGNGNGRDSGPLCDPSMDRDGAGEKTLLYVEDNQVNVTVMKQILDQFQGLKFLSAPNAELGLELVEKHCPDLILMDIDLPGMDGMRATEILKSNEATRDIPVVAVSAKVFEADIKKALSIGFHSYITKPIDVRAFLQALQEILDINSPPIPSK